MVDRLFIYLIVTTSFICSTSLVPIKIKGNTVTTDLIVSQAVKPRQLVVFRVGPLKVKNIREQLWKIENSLGK